MIKDSYSRLLINSNSKTLKYKYYYQKNVVKNIYMWLKIYRIKAEISKLFIMERPNSE